MNMRLKLTIGMLRGLVRLVLDLTVVDWLILFAVFGIVWLGTGD